MSTDLTDGDEVGGVAITRFWGGKVRGVCFQFTDSVTHDYFTISAASLLEIANDHQGRYLPESAQEARAIQQVSHRSSD